MPNFIDLRVRVRSEKLGDLITSLNENQPYAHPVGFDVVKEVTFDEPKKAARPKALMLPAPKKVEGKSRVRSGSAIPYNRDPDTGLTKQQANILNSIKSGAVDFASLEMRHKMPVWAISRIINTLKREGFIEGTNGSYSTTGK